MPSDDPTCLQCPNRSVGRISADPAHRQVLCEYDGWITPRSMRGCPHIQQVTPVIDEPPDIDDEIADAERMV